MWKVGDRVFGRKGSEQFWYAGTVRHLDGDRCYVIFEDGDDALVEVRKLIALELQKGDRVFARQPREAEFAPGEVLDWDADKVRVSWDHGADNWTSYSMIRLQPDARGKPVVRKSAWPAGERIFACWHDLFW